MEEIKTVLNEYYNTWNDAFNSKDADRIRDYMSESFTGFWANSTIDQPTQYDYNYDIDSVLAQYDDAHKSYVPESIIERNDGNDYLIYGTETNTVNGTPLQAKCMFVWRKEQGQWKLVREYIELER
ncbi:nuclear transport factor 2 family protein [Virgibacillus doumboii]|uniref:nuclear transport factor 2 family protein n=1 Tax=Virgibacillus doumboii TaxID=2697503 RepID=UPI0013DF53B4|nr:nuclear transport factor 2 family protein [Virgibacillus doumboii]